MAQNNSKNRKSEEQERFEQADNAGRFAGDDNDAQAARQQAVENIRQDTNSSREERNREDVSNTGTSSDPDQAQANDGDAQNVSDEATRSVGGEESKHSRNKANEGLRQNRNED